MNKYIISFVLLSSVVISPLLMAQNTINESYIKELSKTLDVSKPPSGNFDLSYWKLNPPLPPRPNSENTVLEVFEGELTAGYTEKNWFYTDPKTGAMVLRAPNKAVTTPNSSNARSELRGMIRKGDIKLGNKDKKNNFVISANADAKSYGSIGGELSATLSVDWVSKSGKDSSFSAHAVVIGQIHSAGKTEPLKIYYRKLPNHEKGSLFWNYETNPDIEKNRKNIFIDVFGSHTLRSSDPSPEEGIELGEVFSYNVKVEGSIMTLTFVKGLSPSFNSQVFSQQVDLSKGHPNYPDDSGYAKTWLYFKAGAYNQCNLGSPGCTNNGIEAGDYTQVSFYRLDVHYNN